MKTTMTTSTRSAAPLSRCSSQDLSRTHHAQKPPSPTPLRSNSFAASRRSGIVSEQDALRLAAAATTAALDDDMRVTDPRLPPRTAASAQTGPSQWAAPLLRQQSGDCRPRPLSTGYLPSNSLETQQRVQSHGSQTVKADGVDTQLRLQNVALLPNRQLIQQPGTKFKFYYVYRMCVFIIVFDSKTKFNYLSSSSCGLSRAGRCRSYELAPCLSILRSVVGGC